MGKIGDPRVIPFLIDALNDWGLASYAASKALAQFGELAIPDLLKVALSGKEFPFPVSVIKILADIGEPAIPALIEVLKHGDERARHEARFDIERMGLAAEPFLIALLSSEITHARQSAILALGGIKSEISVPRLLEAVDDPSPDIRWAAISSLGDIGVSSAKEVVENALLDISEVRSAAISALGKIGDASTLKTLEPYVNDEDKSVRWAVAEALGDIGSAQTIPFLIELAHDSETTVCMTALEALGKTHDSEAILPIAEFLTHSDNYIRVVAVKSIGALGTAESVPILQNALYSTDSKVAEAAAEILNQLED